VHTTLVDTNVLIDFPDQDSDWFDWSAAALSDAADRGVVTINPIIYAEVAVDTTPSRMSTLRCPKRS
jgi:hypothetical protein